MAGIVAVADESNIAEDPLISDAIVQHIKISL